MSDRRLSVVTNAIGYELYKEGRQVYKPEWEDNSLIWVTEDETAFAKAIAERVLKDLDEFDRKESVSKLVEYGTQPPWINRHRDA